MEIKRLLNKDLAVEDLMSENPMKGFDKEEHANEEVTVDICQEDPTKEGPISITVNMINQSRSH